MKPKMDESSNWANNAVMVVQSLYSQGAKADFIAGALATAASIAIELMDSSKDPDINKEDFMARLAAAEERAKMRMRAMKK